jgi:endonuclease YncB( thermonuclease family)
MKILHTCWMQEVGSVVTNSTRSDMRRAAIAAMATLWLAFPARGNDCPLGQMESRAVTRVERVAAFTLDDGSRLKLMSLSVPSARDVAASTGDWQPEVDAQAAIAALVSDPRIEIVATGAFRDRYGRRVAHVYGVSRDVGRIWLQAAIIDEGHARVAPLPSETMCLRELFAREAVARAKRAGLWANPAYAVRSAQDPRLLQKLVGTFQIIEGWVAAVGMSRNEVFLNFGRDWKWDFTAAVDLKRSDDRKALTARLKNLKGRLVRVRGFIERRNGPFIALATADAVEELPEGSASGQ